MSHLYSKLLNQSKIKYDLTFLVILIKYGDDNEITSELELPTN